MNTSRCASSARLQRISASRDRSSAPARIALAPRGNSLVAKLLVELTGTRASQIGDSSRLDSPGKPRSHRDEPRGEGRAASEQDRRADGPGIGRGDLERAGRYPQRREGLAEGASPHRQAEDRGADGQKQFRSVKACELSRWKSVDVFARSVSSLARSLAVAPPWLPIVHILADYAQSKSEAR